MYAAAGAVGMLLAIGVLQWFSSSPPVPKRAVGEVFRDTLRSGGEGPEMVVHQAFLFDLRLRLFDSGCRIISISNHSRNNPDRSSWRNFPLRVFDSRCPLGSSCAVSVGSFEPSPSGLYDLHGNVREWIEDCYHENYEGAPTDGSVWTSGCGSDVWAVMRGGSWNSYPRYLRAAARDRGLPSFHEVGFWRQQARLNGGLLSDDGAAPEGWTALDKFTAVMETAALNESERAEYCRKRGLYPADHGLAKGL